jgi:hypothetical protein
MEAFRDWLIEGARRNQETPASLPTRERSSFKIGDLFALW